MKKTKRLVLFGCAVMGILLADMPLAQAATIAHWDFSSASAVDGAFIPGNGVRSDLDGDGAMDSDDFIISAFDLSGNGNHLTVWTSEWMKWSRDSIRGDFSMQYFNPCTAASTDSSFNPHITGTDAETIAPSQWTVEALFKLERLDRFCTVVGRDARFPDNAAAFYLTVRGTDMAVEYRDVDQAVHTLQVPASMKPNVWYNVAAVSDGTVLSLYLNGRVIGLLDLAQTETDTSLAKGDGTWSVARGMWNGEHIDRFFGTIDEVAISDTALHPSAFVIPQLSVGPDSDQDGMGDDYESLFKLDANNGSDAQEDPDGDNLSNFAESILKTDPHAADTDADGLNDDVDYAPLSRAVMWWGHPWYSFGDEYRYTGPIWWLGAGKVGGDWLAEGGWQVSSNSQGMLYIDIDRTIVTNDLMLNLLHDNAAESLVYLDLADANAAMVAVDLYGDLTTDDGERVLSRYALPLAAYPTASRIVIDAQAGAEPYSVWATTLYEDADGDGLDAQQEIQFGTSDTNPDTDGDGLSDYDEIMVHGTDPVHPDTDRDGYWDAEELYGLETSPFVPMWKEGGMPGVLLVERWYNSEGITIGSLTADWRYGALADDCVLVNATEYAPENLHHKDQYGIRMRGTIAAPVAGEYTFQLTGDDAAQVWLSDTESPYGRRLLLDLESWTDFQDLRSAKVPSATVELSAGEAYYFEILMKEHAGAEHVSLFWTIPGSFVPEIIGSNYLYSYVQPIDDADADGLPDEWEEATGLAPDLPNGGGLRDADGDGYSDFEEYAHDLDPTKPDEDADGLSGGDEATITLTDPYSADTDGDGTPDLVVVQSMSGADFIACWEPHSGAIWSTDGTNAILKEVNLDPWVSYNLTVTNAGMYRLAVDATCLYTYNSDQGILAREVRLIVEIDGVRIDELWMNHSSDLPAYTLFTPWLSEGEHTVKLIAQCSWWTTGPFLIHSVELGAIDGVDADGNGVQDWMEAILAKGYDTDGDGITDYDEIMVHNTDPLRTDTDGDGLSDGDELACGTDPLNPDTDGDGITDGEEVLHAFTDPLAADFGASSTLLELDGSNYVASICSWEQDGSSVYARDRNGSLEYALSLPGNGNYVLEIEVAEHNPQVLESRFDLSVAFDGVLVDRSTVSVRQGGTGLLKVWLPTAEAGSHAVLLKWNNIQAGSSLRVNALRLLSYGGPDADGNGQADWLDTRLDNLVGDLVYMQISPVSPVCLEGTSPNHALVSVSADFVPADGEPQAPVVKKGIADGWYANVLLNPYADTLLGVSPSSANEAEEVSVEWFETNVMTVPSNTIMTVRLDDALLLSAIPEGAKQGSMILYIEGPSFTTNLATLTEIPVPYIFDEPGTYVVNGFYSKSRAVHFDEGDPVNAYGFRSGIPAQGVFNNGNTQTNTFSLVVEVVDGRFGTDPYTVLNRSRNWECPNLPTNLVTESDSGVTYYSSPMENGGTDFSLLLTSDKEQTILARLDEGGPVVDRATIYPFAYDTGGYFTVVTTFADGSDLVMFRIMLSDVPEDLLIEMHVSITGAIFEDGSLSKTLTAADFDETGTATYYMICSEVIPSACHAVEIMQATEQIASY